MTDWYDASTIAKTVSNSEPRCSDIRIVTIDGPAGSGKTELAMRLEQELENAVVIHMDDLYEGWNKALDPVLFERIRCWVITPLQNGLSVKHPVFDWSTNKYGSWETKPQSKVVILEGVGSGNADIRNYVSLAIWIEADSELLLDRVVERDGEIVRNEMLIWKSKEEAYFDLHNVKASATIHLRGQGQ